jgi:DNA-binding PadR family transcriptional regulator
MSALPAFERNLLIAINRREAPSGAALRDELRSSTADVIHDPQLYATLDALVTQGFVEKGQQDGRTNAYTLTQVGQRALEERPG